MNETKKSKVAAVKVGEDGGQGMLISGNSKTAGGRQTGNPTKKKRAGPAEAMEAGEGFAVRKNLKKRGPKPKPQSQRLSKYRRKEANARERMRQGEINKGFEVLRERIPHPVLSKGGKCEKLRKIDILHVAISYIRALENILEKGEAGINEFANSVYSVVAEQHRHRFMEDDDDEEVDHERGAMEDQDEDLTDDDLSDCKDKFNGAQGGSSMLCTGDDFSRVSLPKQPQRSAGMKTGSSQTKTSHKTSSTSKTGSKSNGKRRSGATAGGKRLATVPVGLIPVNSTTTAGAASLTNSLTSSMQMSFQIANTEVTKNVQANCSRSDFKVNNNNNANSKIATFALTAGHDDKMLLGQHQTGYADPMMIRQPQMEHAMMMTRFTPGATKFVSSCSSMAQAYGRKRPNAFNSDRKSMNYYADRLTQLKGPVGFAIHNSSMPNMVNGRQPFPSGSHHLLSQADTGYTLIKPKLEAFAKPMHYSYSTPTFTPDHMRTSNSKEPTCSTGMAKNASCDPGYSASPPVTSQSALQFSNSSPSHQHPPSSTPGSSSNVMTFGTASMALGCPPTGDKMTSLSQSCYLQRHKSDPMMVRGNNPLPPLMLSSASVNPNRGSGESCAGGNQVMDDSMETVDLVTGGSFGGASSGTGPELIDEYFSDISFTSSESELFFDLSNLDNIASTLEVSVGGAASSSASVVPSSATSSLLQLETSGREPSSLTGHDGRQAHQPMISLTLQANTICQHPPYGQIDALQSMFAATYPSATNQFDHNNKVEQQQLPVNGDPLTTGIGAFSNFSQAGGAAQGEGVGAGQADARMNNNCVTSASNQQEFSVAYNMQPDIQPMAQQQQAYQGISVQ